VNKNSNNNNDTTKSILTAFTCSLIMMTGDAKKPKLYTIEFLKNIIEDFFVRIINMIQVFIFNSKVHLNTHPMVDTTRNTLK
jgi:radical SAM superfamily enzyme with C-terminal helix-hairpin-helix motif